MIRVVIPDSHGCYADNLAVAAFLRDLKFLAPKEIVMLGDHVDVSGIFNGHPVTYVDELRYSYEEDCEDAGKFLDRIQKAAPRASIDYLEGNHEQHVERWVARTFTHEKDAEAQRRLLAPEAKLRLKERGIKFIRRAEFHDGFRVRGTIRRGKCAFTHGFSAAKFATSVHLDKFGMCVVHGHTHRSQAFVRATVASGEIGAWSPGCLAELTPLYRHTDPSDWTHGYGLQLVEKDGRFLHINVPICEGRSLLKPLLDAIGRNDRIMGVKK